MKIIKVDIDSQSYFKVFATVKIRKGIFFYKYETLNVEIDRTGNLFINGNWILNPFNISQYSIKDAVFKELKILNK